MRADLSEIERRMQPGAWSTHGFLRPGNSLADVLEADTHTLEGLGVTAEALGSRLAELLGAAGGQGDWFRPAQIGEYRVEIQRRRGFITCPWAPEEFEPCPVGELLPPTANQFLIVRRNSGQSMKGFELSAHMIRAHGFFGGPGTRFRIEPEQAAAFLDL